MGKESLKGLRRVQHDRTASSQQGIYKVQMSINFKKIILKFVFLSVAVAWNRNHFILHKGNNSN
jgi:hypothetical protein